MFDIVFPKDNEQLFIKTAEKLGIKGIVFAYTTSTPSFLQQNTPLLEKLQQETTLSLRRIIAVPAKDVHKVRGLKELSLVDASSSVKDAIMKKSTIIYNQEASKEKDPFRYRATLDSRSAQLAKEQKTIIAINFTHLLKNQTPQTTARVQQTILLCRKKKLPLIIASFASQPKDMRAPTDLQSLMSVLGASSQQAKSAVSHLESLETLK